MEKKCPVCRVKQARYFRNNKFAYYRCPDCLTTSTYPYPNLKTLIAHYKKRLDGGNYQLLFSNADEYLKVYNQFLLLLLKSLKKRTLKDMRLLDVGSFTGDFMVLAKEKGANVKGLELQKEAVAIANKKMPKSTIQADITSRNVRESNFDIITMFGLIEHVTQPMLVIASSAKKLKRNGLLMIQTPNASSLFALVMKRYWPPFSPVEHIHLFSRKGLRKMLLENGFEVIYSGNHIKPLQVQYVYNNLQNFAPELYQLISPLRFLFRSPIGKISLPFYIGEMIIIANKIK